MTRPILYLMNFFINKFLSHPWGSPISPLFADMVIDDLENDCLIKLKNEYNCIPLAYYRYVDDTLLIVKKEHVEIVLRVFNSYNEHLQFTHEIEENLQC